MARVTLALLLAGPAGNNLILLIGESGTKAFEVAQNAQRHKSVMVFGFKTAQSESEQINIEASYEVDTA